MGSSDLRASIRRALRWSTLAAVILAISCDDGGGPTVAARVPLAYTRFVHALPDTGPTDWRFIDAIENSPVAFGLRFRDFTPYQATTPGVRALRVFPTSSDISITSQFLIDTAVSFEADTYYTIVNVGFARVSQSPKQQIVVFRDDLPALDNTTIGIRALNLGTGVGAVDVFASDTGASVPLPASPFFAAAAFASPGNYATLPVGAFALRVTSAGVRSPVLAAASAPPGQPADPALNLTAIGGSLMPRSAISALLFPRSVAGTAAPQSAVFALPAVVFVIDKHPR